MFESPTYVFSRVFSLAIRPLLLYWIIYLGLDEESVNFALILSVVASVSYLLSVEVHRDYYRATFENQFKKQSPIVRTKLFSDYVIKVIKISLFGVIIGFISWFLLKGDLLISFLLGGCVALDYFITEYQRYLVFAKRFSTWSFVQLVRYGLPCLIVFLVVPLLTNLVTYVFLISYFFSLLFLTVKLVNETGILRLVKKRIIVLKSITFLSIFSIFKERFAYILAAFSNRHAILIDRYIIYYLDTTFFTLYTLFSLCLSVSPLFVDMFYLQMNRARFAKENIPLFQIKKDKAFHQSLFLGSVFSFISILFIIFTQEGYSLSLLSFSLLLLISFTCFSISIPLYELIFWHRSLYTRLKVDGGYCLLLCFFGALFYFLDVPLAFFLLSMTTMHLLRLFVMTYLLRQGL